MAVQTADKFNVQGQHGPIQSRQPGHLARTPILPIQNVRTDYSRYKYRRRSA